MNEQEKSKFHKMLIATWNAKEKRIEPDQVHLFFEVLKNYTLEEVKYGLYAHLANPDGGQFLPMPADIIRNILDKRKESIPQSLNAARAWGLVMEAIRSVGSYGSPTFGSYAIHKAIRAIGGWQKLCLTPEKHLSFLQKDFERMFEEYSRDNSEDEYLPALTGQSDDPPVFCGREEDRKPLALPQQINPEGVARVQSILSRLQVRSVSKKDEEKPKNNIFLVDKTQ